MTTPLWQALCDHWVNERRGNTGLTIPFLVGATQLSSAAGSAKTPDIGDLAALLFELQSQCPKDRCVRIEMCGTPTKPVVKVSDVTEVHIHAELVKARKGNSRLYVSQTYAHDGTFDSAVQALWTVVGDAIAARDFSYSQGKFRPLNDDEKAFIERVRHAA